MKQAISRTIITAIAYTTVVGISSAAQAASLTHSDYQFSSISSNREPPITLMNYLLEQTSELSGLSISELTIVDTKHNIWSSGCLGFRWEQICTQALVPGWITTVESDKQRWVYYNPFYHDAPYSNGFKIRHQNGLAKDYGLAQHYGWKFNQETQNWIYYMNEFTSNSLVNPIIWDFKYEDNNFLNPSSVESFRYTMIDDSVITNLELDTKTNQKEYMTISAGEPPIDYLLSSSTRPFLSFDQTDRKGVNKFSLTNINPEINLFNPQSSALKLKFNETFFQPLRSVSYEVEVIEKEESIAKSVPEASSLLGLLTFSIFGLSFINKQKP